MPDVEPLVIVGGGPAGLSAARAFRENGGTGAILLLSDDAALPYQRPPLSKEYLRGDIAERSVADEIGLVTAGELASAGIEIRLNCRVADLDPVERRVVCADGEAIGFSTCVLATGSAPKTLPVPGGADPRIHRLRTLEDARRLRNAAERASTVLIIGSGFIGCEAAASLARRGKRVTMVTDEAAPQRARLGRYVSQRIAGWLTEEGVDGVFEASVRSIDGESPAVELDDRRVEADLVVSVTGARPRAELAETAGLAMQGGRILVDERMRTSVPGVLAAGDVVSAVNPTAGRRLMVEHWGEALAMGDVAGAVAAGADARWDAVPGFWSQIGDRQLKYAAWGDGFDEERVHAERTDGFTVWYGSRGVTVGVLTYSADADYEHGSERIAHAAPLPD